MIGFGLGKPRSGLAAPDAMVLAALQKMGADG